ncbi:microtubule-associated tumor suppressor candidate 2 homolog [Neosynchiropus ocellatus]
MSFRAGLKDMQVSVEKIKNRIPLTGDQNANQLSSRGREGCGVDSRYGLPPLVAQSATSHKLAMWGSEPSCLSHELRGFELVDCPDMHAFLDGTNPGEENEDDGESLRDGKDEGPMSISSCSTASSSSNGVKKNDNDTSAVEDKTPRGRDAERRLLCHSTEELDCVEKDSKSADQDRRRRGLKESKSETNVFVSSLATVSFSGSLSSSLDYPGESRMSLLHQKTNHPPNANNATSAHVTRRPTPVDANQNSPPMHPQEKHGHDQYYAQSRSQSQDEGGPQRSLSSSDAGLGHRRRAGFEERVLPPRRQQLVRPLCQTETGRRASLDDHRAPPAETGRGCAPDPQHNGSVRRFSKSSLREPSDFSHLYNVCGASQPRGDVPDGQVSPAQRQPVTHAASHQSTGAAEKRPQTQLTYRRNCSSPNRTKVDSRGSTPPLSPLRTPQSSPRRQPSMYLVSGSASAAARHASLSAPAQGHTSFRAPAKANQSTTGTPKPPFHDQRSPLKPSQSSASKESSSPKPKPKGVRPKIITYVRKHPQLKPQAADGPYQVSSLPSRLSSYVHGTLASQKDPSKNEQGTREAAVLSASNVLFDKYRQDTPTSMLPPGFLGRGLRAPGYTNTVPPAHANVAPHNHTAPPKLGGKAGTFCKASSEVGCAAAFKASSAEDPMKARTAAQPEGSNGLLRSGRGLRLGLGAVHRTASLKGRSSGQGPRATLIYSQPVQPLPPASAARGDPEDEAFVRHAALPASATVSAQAQILASRSVLPKSSQTGLRQPGFGSGRHPAGRLAGFGFVRSSSVSSVTSADSTQSDPCRTAQRQSASEEPPQPTGHQRGPPCRSSLQPPSTPALPRRYLPAQPRSSPGVGRKEFQRGSELTRSLPSSPKRLAVVPPKPQSPVQSGQRSTAAVRGPTPHGSPRRGSARRLQQEQRGSLQREKEKVEHRVEVERLQGRCERQELRLQALREEARRTSLGLEAFIITTQHYCLKNQTAEATQRSLVMEIQMIREELASTSGRWERLVQEKTALQAAFEHELRELQQQQEAELAAVEAGLRKCHSAEAEHLKAEHRSGMEELRAQQQEQVEEMTVHHRAAMQELREMHNITMATLHEEHARTMRDLRKAHEQQKVLLEEQFQKNRLALQDQVDTLTFQNQGLRDKAKRFEEALRRSTDEQIVEALAPYQHIEQDLRSLKEVVEMKNQQIHQQEMKISDLERVAQKNVTLEEKVQVLQQQNEDLKARIDMNLALSRQLSEENANLQESVEKESTEKKRLSRNNEELLWRLQTSPLMSPTSSPLHRSFSSSPVPGCDSPSHCHGCPQQALFASPSHRTNQNLATPTHRVTCQQHCSPGPATPTHRASPSSAASLSSLQR